MARRRRKRRPETMADLTVLFIPLFCLLSVCSTAYFEEGVDISLDCMSAYDQV